LRHCHDLISQKCPIDLLYVTAPLLWKPLYQNRQSTTLGAYEPTDCADMVRRLIPEPLWKWYPITFVLSYGRAV
jgi:hypothetical protein